MKILAVDDDEVIRRLMSEILTNIGFRDVTFAASGKEALNILQAAKGPFDCFLLDIEMPGMTGITLVSHIRKMPDYARTPILMVTSMAERAYVDSAFAAGATDYVNKPIDVSEMHARLQLVSELVSERKKAKSERTDGTDGATALADTSERLHIENIDGVIDYLSLENYLLQLSRLSLFGNCAFGVAIKDSKHLFEGLSHYEFHSAVTDVAEALSECLKPHRFFLAHIGGGDFAGITDAGRQFDADEFELAVGQKLREMDLYYSNGRPMVVHISASDPIQLDWRSSRSSVNALLEAVGNAEQKTLSPADALIEIRPPVKPGH
ncbi:Response regulator receiver domain-containing protein [Sulfitobacter marinus]|uniref:Response regulator receiver domain-containing protein n=1 Tax=Sulfitobacter marinus TaxID=394264 RepID=A0A1I6UIY2_9RHOB|nr:response regulator [Sulfitobacter marinus]SFT01371.1 Response regulator receiver domain-containing protein [Sulfitobacter marinus]